jgi:hypothetical protein
MADRWYWIEIRRGNRPEPVYRFVGRYLKGDQGDPEVYEDQNGHLYCVVVKDAELSGDELKIRTDITFDGPSFDALREDEDLRIWWTFQEGRGWPAEVLWS